MTRTPHPPARKSAWPSLLALAAGSLLVLCLAGIFVVLLWVYLFPLPAAVGTALPAVAGVTPGAGQTAIGQAADGLPARPTRTLTPYQPLRTTPTPTATASATPTATPSPTATLTATPTFTPAPSATETAVSPPGELPERASIARVVGYAQTLPLSCEARSAADWAAFFGLPIAELDFQSRLPITANPNTGFVGDPHGERGWTPPASYGVHAPPVAALLRTYGLNAQSAAGWDWDALRREVASGQPVIAWVIGNTWAGYHGRRYTAPDGETLTVAAFEHTVLVSAYTPDSVTVVDNNLVYLVPLDQFLDSWGVLGSMVVYFED